MRVETEVTKTEFRTILGLYFFIAVMAMTIIPSAFVRALIGLAWTIFTVETVIKLTFGDNQSIKA